MKSKRRKELLLELEKITEENKKLSQKGGLPKELGWWASWVSGYPLESLLVASLVLTGLVFAWSPLDFLNQVRFMLLVGGK